MPYFCVVGSTAASIARLKIEYGGCSVRNRTSPRFSATHCASTICTAGKTDEPVRRRRHHDAGERQRHRRPGAGPRERGGQGPC
jgi:hypothetical protein